MKKKLSIFVAAVGTMALLSGCAVAGTTEIDAPYQLKDVSEYKFEVAADAFLEDPLSNTHSAAEFVDAIAVEEGDPRLVNSYTYEELASCFSMVTELNASNLGEYFTLETLPDDDEYNKIQMNAKEGFYLSKVLVMNFMNQNGGYEQQQYDPFFVNGSLGACEKKDTSWTTEKFKTVELEGKSYIYTFSPAEEMWTNYNDTPTIYVATPSENSHGEFLLLEEYENNPMEISYMLRVIDEMGLLGEGDSSSTPDGDTTPDSGATPDSGSSEQTPAPTPTPEPTPTNNFEGIYWVTNMAYGVDGQRQGFYLDGNGKYITLHTDGTITEWEYSGLEVLSKSNGTAYLFYIYKNGENYGALEYIFGNDGTLYYEWGDGWEGGLDPYFPVSEAEFYGN